MVMTLLRKQNFRCALTGQELVPGETATDHILPVSRGGAHTIDNAQVLAKDVNRAKGTLTNEEFIAMCERIATLASRRRKQRRNSPTQPTHNV